MSDFYTHPKYDAWKLATPWDDEDDDDEDITACSHCGELFIHHELNNDQLCRACEDDAIIAEEF